MFPVGLPRDVLLVIVTAEVRAVSEGKACFVLALGNQSILQKPHTFGSPNLVTVASNLPLAVCMMDTFVSQSKG